MYTFTADPTWPSYSLLPHLLTFSTYHNLGFIHIDSHAFTLHVICLFIKSFNQLHFSFSYHCQVISIQQFRATLNSLDMASMTITNNNGLNPEPWWIPTSTSKPLLLPQTVLTTVFAPIYIDITADTSHSSTPSLRNCPAYHFSWHSIKSFLQIHKTKIELFTFNSKILLHLSCHKMASVVPLPFMKPNCMSSI